MKIESTNFAGKYFVGKAKKKIDELFTYLLIVGIVKINLQLHKKYCRKDKN